ncbi:hypothetical protein [Umezawaea beigongshangensis]|uniref:hypothetical protein n=1 Tax=Umezawaea beigongshangensis TaxID=2780383 RepID=UPI0027DC624E|nr:hypothetical protein [Umezawaea beigongshangensis]
MTVLDPNMAGSSVSRSSLSFEHQASPVPQPRARGLRIEGLASLDWSDVIETTAVADLATSPAEARSSWISRADEQQVLARFRAVCEFDSRPPSPWWLRALHRGKLPSRAAGFAVEDEVTELLSSRPGWVFVPWADAGEVGHWEFVPSESGVYGPAEPTTVRFTDTHPGWVDLLPAHRGPGLAQAIPFTVADLREQIEDIENIA